MNRKLTFYVGLLDKDTKVQRFTTVEAFKIVERVTADHFGGGTISESTGIYKHDDGTVVVEPSLRIEVYATCGHADYVELLKAVLNQESILVERADVVYSFE
jgi:hypothetical protein